MTLKAFIILFFFLILGDYSKAQIKAITEVGKEVVLYKNGTWKYINPEDEDRKPIPTNSVKIVKDPASTFLLKSTRVNMGIWLNSKEWGFKKITNPEDGEYQFYLKGEEAYGTIITEKAQLPSLENFKEIALENGRAISPDLMIDHEEYRTVNKLKVLYLQMSGTSNGFKFIICGYYYVGSNTSIQFIAYTAENLFPEYKNRMETFLNGLVNLE